MEFTRSIIQGAAPPSPVQEEEEERFVTPPGSPVRDLAALPLVNESRHPSPVCHENRSGISLCDDGPVPLPLGNPSCSDPHSRLVHTPTILPRPSVRVTPVFHPCRSSASREEDTYRHPYLHLGCLLCLTTMSCPKLLPRGACMRCRPRPLYCLLCSGSLQVSKRLKLGVMTTIAMATEMCGHYSTTGSNRKVCHLPSALAPYCIADPHTPTVTKHVSDTEYQELRAPGIDNKDDSTGDRDRDADACGGRAVQREQCQSSCPRAVLVRHCCQKPWPGPSQAKAKPTVGALARLIDSESQGLLKPSQSPSFQAKPGQNNPSSDNRALGVPRRN
jgi:hypothetical protein